MPNDQTAKADILSGKTPFQNFVQTVEIPVNVMHSSSTKRRTASDLLNSSFGSKDLSSFNIADYLFKDEDTDVMIRKELKMLVNPIKRGVGTNTRNYIVDVTSNSSEDEVDIETVLETSNIEDLLKQFEATEARIKHENSLKVESTTEKVT